MSSFTTVFKKVYGEALEPYGFVKLKGRQPYFVKLIGDEILLVISYRNEMGSDPFYYNAFDILGGITSVYRRKMALDKSPVSNRDWLASNRWIYGHLCMFRHIPEEEKKIAIFDYEKENEESMLEALQCSLEATKKYLLPELLKVTDLKSYFEYYRFYHGPYLHIYENEDFGKNWGDPVTNEGLLNLKVYNLAEYIEEEKKDFKRWEVHWNQQIKNTENSQQKEEYERIKEDNKEIIRQQISRFEKLYNDPVQYTRVMEELERRKTENLNILRSYGFEV